MSLPAVVVTVLGAFGIQQYFSFTAVVNHIETSFEDVQQKSAILDDQIRTAEELARRAEAAVTRSTRLDLVRQNVDSSRAITEGLAPLRGRPTTLRGTCSSSPHDTTGGSGPQQRPEEQPRRRFKHHQGTEQGPAVLRHNPLPWGPDTAEEACSEDGRTVYRLPADRPESDDGADGTPLLISSVRANVNADATRLALDGDLLTRWASGPQRDATSVEIDLGSVRSIHGIVMFSCV
jgi:hypothetical protein